MADRSRLGRVAGSALLGAGLLLAGTGCAGDALSTDDAATATATTSSPEETSSSASETSASETTTAEPPDEDNDGPLEPEDAGRELKLTDFFLADQGEWEERRYDIADQKDVLGIGTEVASCGNYAPSELELRLGNNFEELTFSVAQANDSLNSDLNLAIEVLGNNEQMDIRSVPFNQVQEFAIDVDGVNALKILLYLDDSGSGCSGSVVGVITGATLD